MTRCIYCAVRRARYGPGIHRERRGLVKPPRPWMWVLSREPLGG